MTINGCNYSPTQYAVQIGGHNGQLSSVALGTTSQVLTSNGAGADPSFQTNTGCWIKLATATPSNAATVDFTSVISSTYIDYVLQFDQIVPAGAGFPKLTLLISSNNGSTWSTTNYVSSAWFLTYGSITLNTISSTTSIYLGSGLGNNVSESGIAFLYNFGSAGYPMLHSSFSLDYNENFFSAGENTVSGTYDAIRILFDSGNITSGTITLYGISK